jgi:glycosyltransferase involved in cell wall biosynthesis
VSSALRVDIVIPAYNAASLLPRVLPAAFAAIRGEGKVIVVDAGAEDDTARVAEELGANVVRIAQRAGPAQARNRGVEESDADVVLFIDADCVPHGDVVERVAAAFGDDPELVSLTGSYDADPPESNFGSMYMNLRHHFTHQRANREGATFWSGCGAVRRTRFVEIGGFDADRYPRPSIEDIEMGQRLASIGRMCLDPDLQVTHLKRWTVRSVIETDIKGRAIPWSLLLHTGGGPPDDLNLRHRERVAAGIAPFALLGIVGIAAFPLLWAGDFSTPGWPIMVMAILPVVVAFILSRDIVRFWWKTRGFWFALRAGIFQQIHLLYSAITFVLCGIWVRFGGGREEFRT